MTIHKTASFTIRPESLDTALAAIEDFVAYVRQNEPRTVQYLSLQNQGLPTRFLQVMSFEDRAAEALHRGSQAVQRFTSILYPCTLDGVSFADYEPIGSSAAGSPGSQIRSAGRKVKPTAMARQAQKKRGAIKPKKAAKRSR